MEQTPQATERISARVCIVGGGPAGVMCGYLLARAGVDVVVLEKHADFLRDFRGDTVHPSTLEVMRELGLLDGFLARKHQRVSANRRQLRRHNGHDRRLFASSDSLQIHRADAAVGFPELLDRRRKQVLDVSHADAVSGDRSGLRRRSRRWRHRDWRRTGAFDVRAALTIGADGRHSDRSRARRISSRGSRRADRRPLDAPAEKSERSRIHARPSQARQNARDHQSRRVLAVRDSSFAKTASSKSSSAASRQFRDDIGDVAPFLRDRTAALRDWNDVSLLSVRVDRLRKWWRPGLLCIGDSAHAMSPVGGIGINLAIQDAVATANICADRLRENSLVDGTLEVVQMRRMSSDKMDAGVPGASAQARR